MIMFHNKKSTQPTNKYLQGLNTIINYPDDNYEHFWL